MKNRGRARRAAAKALPVTIVVAVGYALVATVDVLRRGGQPAVPLAVIVFGLITVVFLLLWRCSVSSQLWLLSVR